MAGADFSSANLRGTRANRANFAGADFRLANLSSADFSGVIGLSRSVLDGACGDENTKLPDGLTVPTCRGRR
jgi:uncharacterized protein YjbI with pentapeptide repeats